MVERRRAKHVPPAAVRGAEPAEMALGLVVKSGWAYAVLLRGPAGAPAVLDGRRVELCDPRNPASRQPYHDGFSKARDEGPELERLVTSVRHFGRAAMTCLLDDIRATARHLRGTAVVVGSLADPDGLTNAHIRIHAREGQLFREVAQSALSQMQLPSSIWRERDLYKAAVQRLERPEAVIRETLAALGRTVAPPWRAEQKAAALGAWLVLAAPRE